MSVQGFSEDFSLVGKTALITGAASGIGQEIARMFARKGADIASFDLGASDSLEAYVAGQGRRYLAVKGDITRQQDIDRAVEAVESAWGRIDILVNSAGIGATEPAIDTSADLFERVLSVNLSGTVSMAQAAARVMLKNGGGKIVNIGSQAGVVALENHLAYGTAKAGVIHATRQMALEWARHNINVNCISPTVIMTEMAKQHWTPEAVAAFSALIPARRVGYPEEVATCAVFLASDASLLVNGANLVIDGGYTIA